MQRHELAALSGLCAAAAVLLPNRAEATYSIAAVDRATGQVGGAVTSCVGRTDVGVVYGGVPSRGVVHAQAQVGGSGKSEALRLLESGTAPAEIITRITATSFDRSAATRQYGVVDLQGRRAGFTGAGAQDYKEDRGGESGSFVFSVQGNILTSARVLDQTAAAFSAGGCDLAERLLRAIEAGAAHGEGDSRCTRPKGIPSDSAFIQVDLDGQPAGSYLKLSVAGTGNADPLIELRARFDEWRRTHPCAVGEPPAAADAGTSRPATRDASAPSPSARDAGRPSSTRGDAAASAPSAPGRDAAVRGDARPVPGTSGGGSTSRPTDAPLGSASGSPDAGDAAVPSASAGPGAGGGCALGRGRGTGTFGLGGLLLAALGLVCRRRRAR